MSLEDQIVAARRWRGGHEACVPHEAGEGLWRTRCPVCAAEGMTAFFTVQGEGLSAECTEGCTLTAAELLPAGKALDGATALLDVSATAPAVWGHGSRVAWAKGETCVVAGPPGVGKGTLAQQVALRRAGVMTDTPVLGLPVEQDERRVLYIAADRPHQARRSMARMVAEDERTALRDRLVVHTGLLSMDVGEGQSKDLLRYVQRFGAGTVVIDSLKDLALSLAKEEVGQAAHRAFQRLLDEGVEVMILHHTRKAQGDNPTPRKLDDVYGSTWVTAGAGSVLVLEGEGGARTVTLHHVKQPAAPIGPMDLLHDHIAGTTTVRPSVEDLLTTKEGTTVADAARILSGTEKPDRAAKEQARRSLEDLVKEGEATREAGEGAARYRSIHRAAPCPPRAEGTVEARNGTEPSVKEGTQSARSGTPEGNGGQPTPLQGGWPRARAVPTEWTPEREAEVMNWLKRELPDAVEMTE